jgi:hypothetical protein
VKRTEYKAIDPKKGFGRDEIQAILDITPQTAEIRAEVGLGGFKPGGPIKKIITIEEN